MYNILAVLFKYLFIVIIYLFIFSIIRLIYLDIKGISNVSKKPIVYLKLINRIDTLPFKIRENYPINKIISLGRGENNDIVIKDPYISKNHFKIIENRKKHYIEDLNSANGTYLNGEKIVDPVKLKNRDLIKIGQIELLFVNRE